MWKMPSSSRKTLQHTLLFATLLGIIHMSEGNVFTGIETSYILTSQPSVLVEATTEDNIENNVFALYFTPWSMNRISSLAYLELYDLYHHYRDFTIQFFAINCEVYSTFCENQGVKVLPSFSHHFNSSIDKYTTR